MARLFNSDYAGGDQVVRFANGEKIAYSTNQ
jgi:hypothetical protein